MEDHTRSHLLRQWAATWLAGIEMEIDRLRSTSDLTAGWAQGGEAVPRAQSRKTVECAFLAFALRNLRELGIVVRGAPPPHDLVRAFDAAVPNVVTARDIFAHPEDYVVGQGRRQRGAALVPEVLDWSVAVDQSRDDVLLFVIAGVRIDAAAGAKAARELADGVVEALGGPLRMGEVSVWYPDEVSAEYHGDQNV
jgi:hypothetical protein